MTFQVISGDCIEVMQSMEAFSVDAIVCDPPYNLSDSGKRDTQCLSRVVSEATLPHDHERDATASEDRDFPVPSLGGSDLGGMDGSAGIDAGICVPEGAVDFDGSPVSEHEVQRGDEGSIVSPQSDLSGVLDSEAIEGLGDFILKPTHSGDASFCDVTCRCFTEPALGEIGVSVVIPLATCGDRLRDLFGGGGWSDWPVGAHNDSGSEPEPTSGVVAGAGAVVHAVLRLDLSGRAGYLLAADRACESDARFLLLPSELVGARSGAGGLSSVLQPLRISVVGAATGGTLSLYLPLHRMKASRSVGGFMGKSWDGWESPAAFQRWCTAWAREALRVLKPGGYLLAFGGTRTFHRLACAVEDAGFEIRDRILVKGVEVDHSTEIAWLYGSGFPKSLNVSKAIAKRAGGALRAREAVEWMRTERERLGISRSELEIRVFGRSDGNVRNWEDGISIPAPGLWVKIRDALGHSSSLFDEDMERGDVVVATEDGDFGFQASGERWDRERVVREPATELADRWSGFGTALKPAHEPIVVARKPLVGTVALNVTTYGTGGLNIDGCRVGYEAGGNLASNPSLRKSVKGGNGGHVFGTEPESREMSPHTDGRWPANVVLVHAPSCRMIGTKEVVSKNAEGAGRDGSETANRIYGAFKKDVSVKGYAVDGLETVEAWECVEGCPVRVLDEQTGVLTSGRAAEGGHRRNLPPGEGIYGGGKGLWDEAGAAGALYGDAGGASRFFSTFGWEAEVAERLAADPGFLYQAKASRAERNVGCDAFEKKPLEWSNGEQNPGSFQGDGTEREARNNHPTVKSIELMRWLIRLVCPPGGRVLDPFLGSGSTGCAAMLEGCVGEFVGIEREEAYVEIARARISFWTLHGEDALRVVREREQAERLAVARRQAAEDGGQLDLLGGLDS